MTLTKLITKYHRLESPEQLSKRVARFIRDQVIEPDVDPAKFPTIPEAAKAVNMIKERQRLLLSGKDPVAWEIINNDTRLYLLVGEKELRERGHVDA